MELNEFNNFLRDEIASGAELEMITLRESFFSFYSRFLMDAEEFDEFVYMPYEGIGKNNRRIQVDGYAFDELDNTLLLFVAPILTNFNFETITKTEADRYFSRALSFFEDASYVTKLGEESSEGYGLAHDCLHLYKNVSKIRIYLFTDQIMSKQIRSIENSHSDGKVVEYHLWTEDWKRMVDNSKFKGWDHFINAGGENKEGYIGLQDHGDDVWFRNIKIKILD